MENIEVKVLEFLKGLGTILLYLGLGVVLASVFYDFVYHENKVIASIGQLFIYLVMFLVLALIYRKRLKEDFKNFKKDYVKVAFKNWLIGLGVMVICNIIVSSLVGDLASNEEANRSLFELYPISSAITMIILAPISEEIAFRASFKKCFSKWYTFAIVTALLFGSAHISNFFTLLADGIFDYKELLYLLPYSALGFFFGKAFYETDNIYTSYLAHMFHNGICVLLLIVLALIGG